ncbi:hypothetical protein [Emticicia sp. C21]|uniref:hypothetical protein n=1 Tax=Emticicia sp. C21 TaxID=2302915 RepID=UPI000E7D6461|nr:hypothetical protein [Emticicia sp. C21]RFS18363.1 hypothetical protein D0T08_03695 [Emticicia sp. C21]
MFLTLFYLLFSQVRHISIPLPILILNKISETILFANNGSKSIHQGFLAVLKKLTSSYLYQYFSADTSHIFKTNGGLASLR